VAPEEWTRLWRHMFDYFETKKELDNLLWVYAPNAQTTASLKPPASFYPGDRFVDVVGLDYYADQSEGIGPGGYQEMLALDKPFGLTEFGPLAKRDGSFDCVAFAQQLRKHYPQTCFLLAWHSWQGAKVAIVDQQNVPALIADDWIATLDELPAR
jgi:mannan endo-1,4-beta-mannosidase